MVITIASIMNLMGPDLMVILLIVLLLFGAKKLPELARGIGKAVKEFSSARDEIERELSQSTSDKATQPRLPSTSGDPLAVQRVTPPSTTLSEGSSDPLHYGKLQ
jgi:sec-independent protein translocase protein TatA